MGDDKNSQQLESALIKAKQLLNDSKVAEAMLLLTDVLNISPQEPRALKMFEYAKSLKGVEEGSATLVNAEKLFSAGEYENAMAVVQSVIKADPLHEKAIALGKKIQDKLEAMPFIMQYEQSGQKLFDEGNFSGAIEEWKKIKELDSNYTKVDTLISEAQSKMTSGGSTPASDLFLDEPAPELSLEGEDSIDPEDPFAFDNNSSAQNDISINEEPVSEIQGFIESPEISEADIPTEIQSDSTPDLPETPEFESSDLSIDDTSTTENNEMQSQIDQYFNEGLELYERGQCQQAIDKWQLIFVYDENNEKAKEYIKKAQIEIDQKEQSVSTEDVNVALAEGDYGRAGVLCDELLAGDPGNEEYLALKKKVADDRENNFIIPTLNNAEQMMNQGMYNDALIEVEKILAVNPVHEEATALISKIHTAQEEEASAESAPAPESEFEGDFDSIPEEVVEAEVPVEKSSSRMLLIIVVIVIIVGAAGFFLFKDKISGTKDVSSESSQGPGSTETTQKKKNAALNLRKAKKLIKDGSKIDALKLLRTIDTSDIDEFPEAISLIKEVEESLEKEKENTPVKVELTPEEIREKKQNQAIELVVKAKAVLEQNEYNTAKQYVDEALNLDPTNLDAMDLKDKIGQKIALASDEQKKYNEAVSYYNEGLYQDSLRMFYRLQQEGKMEEKSQKYIELAWFNWGVRELKNANCTEAIKKFTEYLSESKTEDTEALKHIKVAEKYKSRAKDDLFKHYIEFIDYRKP